MKPEQLLEASTTINLYYNNPEWQSIVQDLHKRYGLSPNIPWEEVENIPQNWRALLKKLAEKSKIKPFVPTVYLLLYDTGLLLLGNPSSKAAKSVQAFGYHFDRKQGAKTNWPATFGFIEQDPIRAVYEAPLSLRNVITRSADRPSPQKMQAEIRAETDKIKKDLFRFLLPVMEKYVNRAIADVEGIIIQYIRSGNYNAIERKVDALRSLSSIRDLLNSSRPLRTAEGLTDWGLNLYTNNFIRYRFNNALDHYKSETKNLAPTSVQWLRSIQTDKSQLAGLLQHFYEQLIR